MIAAQPGIVAVTELVVTFIGPRQAWVVARVAIDEAMSGASVEKLMRTAEDEFETEVAGHRARGPRATWALTSRPAVRRSLGAAGSIERSSLLREQSSVLESGAMKGKATCPASLMRSRPPRK